jgi:hypothetical protein
MSAAALQARESHVAGGVEQAIDVRSAGAEHLGRPARLYALFFIAASNCQATTALTAWS